MWNAFRTDARTGITAEVITYPGGGDEIHAWFAPADRGAGRDQPVPGIVAVRGGAERHGKAYEFHRYDGLGHGIFYYHTSMDWPEQAMDGWEKVFGFSSRDLSG